MQEGKRLEQNFMCAVTGPWVTKKVSNTIEYSDISKNISFD